MSAQTKHHWKHAAIEKSGLLSDLWDIFISYGGRAAGWILFGCMVCNILQIIPNVTIPQLLINIVMGTQIITLDIAGFGLNTIAKHVLKSTQDTEARKTAESAKKLAKCLIGLMILTVGLITVGYLYPPAKQATDIIDKVLILARIVLIVIYMHTMHDLRQAELEVIAQAEQTAQANDQLLLDQVEQVKGLASTVHTLSAQQAQSTDRIDRVYTELKKLADRIDTTIDKGTFESLSRQVYSLARDNQEMRSSVTEVHQNVLQITQNLYSLPAGQMVNAEQEPRLLPEGTIDQAPDTDGLTDIVIPPLEVPGVSSEKVADVVAAFLGGMSWSKIATEKSINYSRTIKPIREAYEQYVSSEIQPNTEVYTPVHTL
ncbi:hypothetical protein [Dictyobacter kobayashii]|uniref:Uncharacterized protein n=1 Tax=Dictyobacter kobayashii TaxID=2014872 RepID=A0A402AIP5_9CHLR|nr:hypothetical protein [Dictyobacter kobayashii]GCE18976.1 hypothetical protein KDK_27760 [Dictyobacter kobayashii]